jgi:hypothetical protein
VCVTTITRARGPDDGGGFAGGVGEVGVDESSPEQAVVVIAIARIRMIAASMALALVRRLAPVRRRD